MDKKLDSIHVENPKSSINYALPVTFLTLPFALNCESACQIKVTGTYDQPSLVHPR